MMTRKDYKAIADVLNEQQKDFSEHDDGRMLLAIIASRLSQYMAQDNPRFDRSKFLTACGVK
jgi:hypothetical protein